MNTDTKVCNECERELPDDSEHFNLRLKTGGIWGTTAKCKACMNLRSRLYRKAKKRGLSLNFTIPKMVSHV